MGLMETLKNASDDQFKKSEGRSKWITVGVNSESHSQLKEIASWYALSLSETLRIIMRDAHNDFTYRVVGGEPKNNNTEVSI